MTLNTILIIIKQLKSPTDILTQNVSLSLERLAERMFAVGQNVVEYAAEREYVDGAGGALALEHLRGDPAIGAGYARAPRERHAAELQLFAEAKVRDHGAHLAARSRRRQQHVVRLYVPMHCGQSFFI